MWGEGFQPERLGEQSPGQRPGLFGKYKKPIKAESFVLITIISPTYTGTSVSGLQPDSFPVEIHNHRSLPSALLYKPY